VAYWYSIFVAKQRVSTEAPKEAII
jgi:hypothetical protein